MAIAITLGVLGLLVTVYALYVLLATSATLFPSREDKVLWFLFVLSFNALGAVLFLVRRQQLLADQASAREARQRAREPDPLAELLGDETKPRRPRPNA